MREIETSILTAEMIKDYLKKGVMHFFYKKNDGSLREAFGTLCEEILLACIPENREGDRREIYKARNHTDPDIVRYFDIVSDGTGAFRSFRRSRLVRIDADYDPEMFND